MIIKVTMTAKAVINTDDYVERVRHDFESMNNEVLSDLLLYNFEAYFVPEDVEWKIRRSKK